MSRICEDVLREIEGYISGMSPEEVSEFYYELTHLGYCTKCGQYIGDKTCHCENDE